MGWQFFISLKKTFFMALNNKPVFTDKRTKDKIDLHLRDINDKITEEDIENVQTDVTATSEEGSYSIDREAAEEAGKILEKKQREEKDKEDGNNSNSIETPWNMLD